MKKIKIDNIENVSILYNVLALENIQKQTEIMGFGFLKYWKPVKTPLKKMVEPIILLKR